MTLLAQLGEGLPERYYLGLDIGYKEHVGVVISLETFVRGGERWKRARCLHFPSTQAGWDKFQQLMAVVLPEWKTFFTKSVASLAPVSLVAAYPTAAGLAAACNLPESSELSGRCQGGAVGCRRLPPRAAGGRVAGVGSSQFRPAD